MAKLLLLVSWTLLGFFTSEALLNENLCRRQVISLNRQPVGSLHVIVPDLNTDCTIELHPQWGFSVVLSIYQYYVPHTHLLSVEDSDGYKISLLGQGLFPNNKKSIISEGTMKIRYFVDKTYASHAQATPSTINETETDLEDNSTEMIDVNNTVVTIMNETSHSSTGFGFFYFTYTQVGNGPCGKSEFACQNGKCLPELYVCSGHNRCGDNSDNKKCGPQPTVVPKKIASSPVSNQTVILICTGVLVIALLITAYIIICVGKYNKSGKPNNSTPPLQSVSSNVDVPTDQPPRVPEEASASMCSRVQHFFRQEKDDKVEENLQTRPSERFEVPSMYPNLQPTAPEYGNTLGRENRGFSSERE